MDRIKKYGYDILNDENMLLGKKHYQHGSVTVYEHCVSVAEMCIIIKDKFHLNVDERTLIRGALLHDFFLYDWHEKGHSLHGFRHPGIAKKNANKYFYINNVEKDMIKKHMFPLTIKPPRYKESMILCIADKIVALKETVFLR